MYLYAPKEESLVPIENFRATRINLRNLPNIEIANWIAEHCQMRHKIQQGRSTNIIMHMRQEAELQILDHQFRMRVNDTTRNITTMQQNGANAVNNNNSNNNNETTHHSCTLPPEEEPPN